MVIYTAPGRGELAARKAAAMTSGMASEVSTSTLDFVIGRNKETLSMLWCVFFNRMDRGTDPVIAITGSPSQLAVARAVTRTATRNLVRDPGL
jgi:hypothetical protein